MNDCKQCPHVIGDSYQRDCCFPDCIGWTIEYNPKPIPSRMHDYDFYHIDHEKDHGLAGTTFSMISAMEKIAEIEANRELSICITGARSTQCLINGLGYN